MKIAYSPNSPYVRKAMACAISRSVTIETWVPAAGSGELAKTNPLSKVPTLITDDGMVLYDSPVICEYLDNLGSAPKLFPPAGPARWNALRQMALGDGIMDACQPRRREIALPQDAGRIEYIATQRAKVDRGIAVLEAEADTLGALTTIGEITIACALGYLDFRYANEPWRQAAPKLTAWYAKVSAMPPIAQTVPPG
ncbi:MAG: glutathione S-transferase [Acetobacteraceae bacterium]|nr:glutathione S-transferase [Acetobacteraceae bacterium]